MLDQVDEASTETTENVQESLAADTDGTYRVFLLEDLHANYQKVTQHLELGLVPEEYEKFLKLQKAIAAAVSVLESPSA